MEAVIDIKGLSVSYGSKRILTNIYLQVYAGNVYGVIGPNGAGKSTLFKSILQLIDTTAGSISVFGSDLSDHRKKVAYVPQKDDIDWDFPASVRDVVMMGRYPHKNIFERLNKEDYQKVDDALDKLDIKHLADNQIGRLSGGQQQRVFIARALAQEAQLLFFDEPFVGIDITTEEKIVTIMHELAKAGKTILVVHHDLTTVEAYFSHVIMINQRLIGCGPTSEVFIKDNISQCYGAQLSILHKVK